MTRRSYDHGRFVGAMTRRSYGHGRFVGAMTRLSLVTSELGPPPLILMSLSIDDS